jgi:hypothetical protein
MVVGTPRKLELDLGSTLALATDSKLERELEHTAVVLLGTLAIGTPKLVGPCTLLGKLGPERRLVLERKLGLERRLEHLTLKLDHILATIAL